MTAKFTSEAKVKLLVSKLSDAKFPLYLHNWQTVANNGLAAETSPTKDRLLLDFYY